MEKYLDENKEFIFPQITSGGMKGESKNKYLKTYKPKYWSINYIPLALIWNEKAEH